MAWRCPRKASPTSKASTWPSSMPTPASTAVLRPRPTCSAISGSARLPSTRWCSRWSGSRWPNKWTRTSPPSPARSRARKSTPAGELRVTTSDTLLVHLLTPLFAGFRAQCPDVRLDIVLGNQALNLSKRDADVAIRATDTPPELLVGRRVARIAWALYGAAAGFPGQGPFDQAALLERHWVSLGDDLAPLQAVRFVRERIPPERIAYKVNTVLGLARPWRPASASAICPASSPLRARRWYGSPRPIPPSPPTSGYSPTPTCATRRGSACSSTSWRRRSPTGVSSLRAQRRTRPLEKRKPKSSLLLC